MKRSYSFSLPSRKIKSESFYNDRLSFGSMPDLNNNPDISENEFNEFVRKNNEILKLVLQTVQIINSSDSSNLKDGDGSSKK